MNSIPSHKPYPNIWQAIVLGGIWVVCNVATSWLLPYVSAALFEDAASRKIFFYGATYLVSGAITLGIGIRWKRNTDTDTPLFHLHDIPLGIYPLLFALLFMGLTLVAPLLRMLPESPHLREVMNDIVQYPVVLLGLGVVIAPVFEELLLRGIILDGLLKRYAPWQAILVSAVIFGAMHLNLQQGINAFFLGLLIGWMYWLTGSLLPCFFIHIVNNGASAVALYTYGMSAAKEQEIVYNTSFYGAYLFCLISVVWLIWLINQQCRQWQNEKQEEEE